MQILDRTQLAQIDFSDLEQLQALFWQTFQAKAAGRAVNAQEIDMVPESIEKGAFYSLPGYLLDRGVVGLKWTTHVPTAKGPFTEPLILLNDIQTGKPLAVIDGLRIGGLRTALVTSLAIRRILAGSPQQLLICGSGFQAAQHLATLRAALPQAQFVVWDRTPEHAQRLAAKFDHRVTVSLNLADAVANADVVIGATSASTPYLKYDWFHSGQLYVHIGLHDMAPADVAKFQWLVCDDYRAGQLTSQQSLFVAYRQGAIAAERVRLLETLVTPLRVPGPVMFDQFGLQMFDFVLAEYALSQVEKGVSFGHGIARN